MSEIRRAEVSKAELFVSGVKVLKDITFPDLLTNPLLKRRLCEFGATYLRWLSDVPTELTQQHLAIDNEAYDFLRTAVLEGVIYAYIKKHGVRGISEFGLSSLGVEPQLISKISGVSRPTVYGRINTATSRLWELSSHELKEKFGNQNPLPIKQRKNPS